MPPFCYGSSSVSGSISSADVNGNFQSVVEQSGIAAGDAGFQVEVQGHTELTAAAISSSEQAIKDNGNRLTTGSLQVRELINHDEYEADGYGFSASMSSKLGDQSGDRAQSKMSPQDKAAAGTASKPGASAGVANESGSRSSITPSRISAGSIVITDEAQQLEKTGQDADTVIASLNRDVTTGSDTTHALSKAWDGYLLQKDIEAQVALAQVFSQLSPKAVGDYAQGKLNEAAALRARASTEADAGKADAMRQQAAELEANWGEKGAARIALHTLVGALSGGGQGAAGAAATAVATPSLAEQIEQLDAPQEVKQALMMMAGAAVGGVAGGTAGVAAGYGQVTNNYLNHAQLKSLQKDIAECRERKCTGAEEESILKAYAMLSAENQAALLTCTTHACLEAHQAAIDEAKSLAPIVLDDIHGREGFQLRGLQTVSPQTINALHARIDATDRVKAEVLNWEKNNCQGMSQTQCVAKFKVDKAFVAGLIADFMPVVGDLKSLYEAEGVGDYLMIVGEVVLGPIADTVKVVRNAKKAASARQAAEGAGHQVSAAAKMKDAAQTSPNVDVLSPESKRHILYGDGPGSGGHLWPGQPGKTSFPKGWSADKIINEIGDIATSPSTKWYAQTGTGGLYTTGGKPARWVAYEVRDGVRIRVVFEPATGRVVTGFPDSGPVPDYKSIKQ